MDKINKLFELLNYDQYKTWKPTINNSNNYISKRTCKLEFNTLTNKSTLDMIEKKKINYFQTSKIKTLDTKDEYLFELDKNFPNLIIKNITKLFYEWCKDINLNPIQVQWHLKYLWPKKIKSKLHINTLSQLQFKTKILF